MDLKVPTASPWSGEYNGIKIKVISHLQPVLFSTIHKSLIVLDKDIDVLIVLDLEILYEAQTCFRFMATVVSSQ
jgi:hypothetical protein